MNERATSKMTISRGEAARRLGYHHTGETDSQLTARLNASGDDAVVESRGNPSCYGSKKTMPCWNGDGYCIEEGDDPMDGYLDQHCGRVKDYPCRL